MVNYDSYRGNLIDRLQRQERATGDPVIRELLRECQSYPGVRRPDPTQPIAPVLKVRFVDDGPVLSFFTIVSTLGLPYDVTLDEIAIESFFPADAATAEAIGMSGG
jgi:hypothetical protein